MSNQVQQFLQLPILAPPRRRERMCTTCQNIRALPLPAFPPPPPFGAASPFPPIVDFPRERQSAALEHQSRLKEEFSRLVHALNKDDQSKAMEAISMHLDGLDAVMSDLISTQAYNERKAPDSSTALRTFAIPELLELILDQLTIRELLTTYQVSRGMCDAIDNSSRLQIKLALRPNTADSHFRAPFQFEQWGVADGFTCAPDYYAGLGNDDKQSLTVRANFYLYSGQTLGKLAPRSRRMFICQPPPTEMAVVVRCCGEPWPATPEEIAEAGDDVMRRFFERKIEAATGSEGLTIGDLYDCAAKVIEMHRYCPHASKTLLDDSGFVNCGVSFRGQVALTVGDPVIEERERDNAAARAASDLYTRERLDRRAYTNAKRAAHRNGRSVLTMTEFLAEREGRVLNEPQQPSAAAQQSADAVGALPDPFAYLPISFANLPDPLANLPNP